MIDRYTRPEMGNIFELEHKYEVWQEIEVLACEAHAELGESGITKEEAKWIRDHAKFNKAEVGRDRGRDQPRRDRVPDEHGLLHRRGRARGRAEAQSVGSTTA
jgi:adenylosuccinate lyase